MSDSDLCGHSPYGFVIGREAVLILGETFCSTRVDYRKYVDGFGALPAVQYLLHAWFSAD